MDGDNVFWKGIGVLKKLRFLYAWVLLCGAIFLASASLSHAQAAAPKTDPKAPFDEQSVQKNLNQLSNLSALSDTEKQQLSEIYTNALAALRDAKTAKNKAGQYQLELKTAPQTIEKLEKQTESLRANLGGLRQKTIRAYAKKSLEDKQHALDQEQTNATNLRNLQDEYEKDIQTLDARPARALEELNTIEKRIETLKSQIAAYDSKADSPLERASQMLARAQLYAALWKKRELEQEQASLVARRKILDKRRALVAAQINQSNEKIAALSELTGAARVKFAANRLDEAKKSLQARAGLHPLVQAYLQENIRLAEKNLELARSEGNLPAEETELARRLRQVKLEKNVAEKILNNRGLNRTYAEHLRSLRKKQPNPEKLARAIKKRESELQDALFRQTTADEALGIFNAQPFDPQALKTAYDSRNGTTPPLSETDIEALQAAYDSRRSYLNDLASITNLKARKLEEVKDVQKKLYEEARALNELLDARLLWLPSTERIGVNWPANVIQGGFLLFSANNLQAVARAFINGIKHGYFVLFLWIGLLSALHVLRNRMAPVLVTMSSRVGRVQRDGYTLTPLAVLDVVLAAFIPTGLILGVALTLYLGAHEYEIVRNFIHALLLTGIPVFVILFLRAASRKGGLFDVHFGVDPQIRDRLLYNTGWLVIALPLGVFLMGLTDGTLEYDTEAAALAVLGFLIAALSLSWFAFKLVWKRTRVYGQGKRRLDSIYLRNERWFLFMAVLLPLATAVLSALGYYETGRLLLARMFFSFCVLLAAYIVHGLLKRSIEIAQRRLALEQARERRDRMMEERRARAEAEERGEIPVPKLDTESINLETINRQSRQLVNIIVFVGTGALLWALWKDILPALSVFNEVTVWSYQAPDTDGKMVSVPITLWNILQAMFIALVTWFAARSVPGFLEMFVLKRLNMQQSSRFAVTTIVGYIIFAAGLLMAFDKLGVQWSSLQWIVAALGVGIGFGLQAIFANFISGLIILFERPIRIGDYITIGEISGTVTRIQIRATTLLDLDNKEILIPNQEIISQDVTNWTLANPVTRLIINVGIAYGSDTELAHKTMLETVRKNAHVLDNPEPRVLFLGFGDNALDFEVRVFLRDFAQRFVVSHELHMALDAALREVKVEIAFPQRDIHIRGGEGLEEISKALAPAKPPGKA